MINLRPHSSRNDDSSDRSTLVNIPWTPKEDQLLAFRNPVRTNLRIPSVQRGAFTSLRKNREICSSRLAHECILEIQLRTTLIPHARGQASKQVIHRATWNLIRKHDEDFVGNALLRGNSGRYKDLNRTRAIQYRQRTCCWTHTGQYEGPVDEERRRVFADVLQPRMRRSRLL